LEKWIEEIIELHRFDCSVVELAYNFAIGRFYIPFVVNYFFSLTDVVWHLPMAKWFYFDIVTGFEEVRFSAWK